MTTRQPLTFLKVSHGAFYFVFWWEELWRR